MEYILIVLCLIGSAFFSGTEIAYTSLSKLKMKQFEESKSPLYRLVNYIYNHYYYSLSSYLHRHCLDRPVGHCYGWKVKR